MVDVLCVSLVAEIYFHEILSLSFIMFLSFLLKVIQSLDISKIRYSSIYRSAFNIFSRFKLSDNMSKNLN